MIFFPLPLKNISEIIHSETVRNSFILEPLRAFKFKNFLQPWWKYSLRNNKKFLHLRAPRSIQILNFSSTMVKVFIQKQLEIPSFWSISEHSNSKFSSSMVKSNHSEAIIMDDHFRRFKFKIRPWWQYSLRNNRYSFILELFATFQVKVHLLKTPEGIYGHIREKDLKSVSWLST